MEALSSPLPPTLLTCPSALPTEKSDHNKEAVEQDKHGSSKMKDQNIGKALKVKPVELEDLPEHLLRCTLYTYLIEKKIVLPSRFDIVRGSLTYKITSTFFLHRSLRNAPQKGYLKLEKARLGSVSEQIQHLFLISKNINPTIFNILSKFKHLCTLVLHCQQFGSSIGCVPHKFFLSVKQLRSLVLRRSCVSEMPSSIGDLKYLRYLDVSETAIKCLPESIDRLDNLQTLALGGCLKLVGLPSNVSKLANRRHSEFDILGRLNSMPVKMGNLTGLQTLRAFLVGKEVGCRIEELKNLINISGSFCISRLENVLSSHEAKEAAMTNKKYVRQLELRWGNRCIGGSKTDEEIRLPST